MRRFRPWDHSFMTDAWSHIYESCAKSHAKGVYVGCERQVDTLRRCAYLCKRLTEDAYTTPWDEECSRIWEEYPMLREDTPDGGCVVWREIPEKYEKIERLQRNRRVEQREQDKRYLGELMARNLDKWWV